MDWIILIVAGLFETAFAFCLGKMNEAKGKRRRFWATGFAVCLAISMWLLAVSVQTLPIGTASYLKMMDNLSIRAADRKSVV